MDCLVLHGPDQTTLCPGFVHSASHCPHCHVWLPNQAKACAKMSKTKTGSLQCEFGIGCSMLRAARVFIGVLLCAVSLKYELQVGGCSLQKLMSVSPVLTLLAGIIIALLLLKAGDVESNPGPTSESVHSHIVVA